MREQLIKLLKKHNLFSNTDEQIKKYVDEYYGTFYLHVEEDELKGYASYFMVGKTLYLYDLVCEGSMGKMWSYCRDFMRRNNINRIIFTRNGKEKQYGR